MKRILITCVIILGAMMFVAGCEEDKVVRPVGEVPAVPTGVSSFTGDHQVEIYWRGNNDNGLTEGYGVYRYTGTVGELDQYERIGRVGAGDHWDIAGDEDVYWYSFVDAGLTNGNTYYYAVNAYNKYGESNLSKIDAMDTPRPNGIANFRLFDESPERLGFDFSNHRTVAWDSDNADIFVEFDSDLQQYFVDVANGETYLQDYGYIDDLSAIGWGEPGGGWSELGWSELLIGHGYLVYTADGHYAAIWISDINYQDGVVYTEWAYQTAPDNPELKRGLITRPQHDANYGKRKGN